MPIGSIVALVVLFLVGLLFCKMVEVIVEPVRTVFVGNEIDVIELVRIEVRGLHIKVDAIWKKLDDFKIEFNQVKSKPESTAALTQQLSIVPASPTTAQEVPEDTWERGEVTLLRNELVSDELVVTAPTIDQSTSSDTWTRDTSVYWSFKAADHLQTSERAEGGGSEPATTRQGQACRGHARQASA
jgi:hypothetical protein